MRYYKQFPSLNQRFPKYIKKKNNVRKYYTSRDQLQKNYPSQFFHFQNEPFTNLINLKRMRSDTKQLKSQNYFHIQGVPLEVQTGVINVVENTTINNRKPGL